MMLSDLQIDQLTKHCAEKASELERLKEELETCDNHRLDLSEQLGIITADKNIADTDLKTSRTEAARQKKELEVLVLFSSLLYQLFHSQLFSALLWHYWLSV